LQNLIFGTHKWVKAEEQRQHPWFPDRRSLCLEDAADDDALDEHVIVLIVPLAGSAGWPMRV